MPGEGSGIIRCQECGWSGRVDELIEREGEPETADGFLIWLDMRRNRRVEMLCPKCKARCGSKATLYGYEFAPLTTRH